MRNPYRNTARGVARVGVGRVPKARPPRPYTRNQRPRPAADVTGPPPVTQTPTMTGTGVTTVSGGNLPGAPPTPGLPPPYGLPKVKNWNKASAAQIAQAMLAPQYASLAAQQHQAQLMAGQQQAAITSYGADLARILGAAGPNGVKGTLPPEYAAALSMANLRNFAYQQFLQSQKFADEYGKIAAQYPTYLNQIMAQKAEMKLKQDAFNLQKLVAAQTYNLNVQKTQAYNQATNARLGLEAARVKQSGARLGLSRQQFQLAVAKANQAAAQWNAGQADKTGKIDLSLSRASGQWVNSQGRPLRNVPFKNPPPPYYKPSAAKKGGKDDPYRGLTQTQYRNAYGDALKNAQAARSHGVSRTQFMEQAVMNRIPRWVADKAWKQTKPKPYPKGVGRGRAVVGG